MAFERKSVSAAYTCWDFRIFTLQLLIFVQMPPLLVRLNFDLNFWYNDR